MKKRLFRCAAHLPGKARESDDASTIFADFDRRRRGKLAKSGLQFCGELPARDYKTGYL